MDTNMKPHCYRRCGGNGVPSSSTKNDMEGAAPSAPQRRTSGQAMIELMLGVIMIMLLLAGTELLLSIANAHCSIDGGVRARSGTAAFTASPDDTPRNIGNWQAGPDGLQYTADDVASISYNNTVGLIAGNTATNQAQMAEYLALAKFARPSSFATLSQAPAPLGALGFVGYRWSTTVPVSQIAQDLFYNSQNVTVQEDVWMPVMSGLY